MKHLSTLHVYLNSLSLSSFSWFLCRIVEKGYYSERDAADAVKQILEAVAVSIN